MTKKSGFAGFIEVRKAALYSCPRRANISLQRTKYSTESKNRVGLRELLMEPIQRIPRYTLMFRSESQSCVSESLRGSHSIVKQ